MSSRLSRFLQVLLRLGEPPHRTAMAFAVGVWIAFCPLLGAHTALALLLAFLFKLNRVTVLLGAYVNNPWTLVPLFMAGTFLGCLVLGMPPAALWTLEWPRHGWNLHAMYANLRPIVAPFIIGNLTLGTLSALLSYGIVRRLLERRQTGKTIVEPNA